MRLKSRYGKYYKIEGEVKSEITKEEFIELSKPMVAPAVEEPWYADAQPKNFDYTKK